MISQVDGSTKAIRVLLADDHSITREGTRRILDAATDIAVVAEAADGEETVRLAQQVQPDVLLLDISMPLLNGIQVARALRLPLPNTRIVILTGYENEQYVPALLRLGVKGYLSKTASSQELLAAIRNVFAGQSYFQPSLAGMLVARSILPAEAVPTPRELDVLCLVAEGKRNLEIARALSTSERTVQFHLSNLFAKLGTTSRTETVYQARKLGWLG